MIHATAQVDGRARLGENVKVWNWVQIREDAEIGDGTILSKGVYVDSGVHIGRNVKIQNNVSVYHGVTIEDGVFVGPHVCFTNDKVPRAINPDGSQKGAADWEVWPILIRRGASLGANSTILPGVTVGCFALVGAGAVVTRDVPDHGLVVGNPARLIGRVCSCGERLDDRLYCRRCDKTVDIEKG
ncbi:MAG: N-acetyltransferase [Spirochaetales bacterium]|nr:N-acetyltransferase [Spirochaetales bacterium]